MSKISNKNTGYSKLCNNKSTMFHISQTLRAHASCFHEGRRKENNFTN